MSPHEKDRLRVSGILFACDPAGVAKYHQVDEYDLYCDDILACTTRGELEVLLRNRDLYGLGVFASLKHYLGLDETVDELYPIPDGAITCSSTPTPS